MEDLDEYTPSFEEFSSFIKTTNPRSAGGMNGLNYLMVQNLPEELVERRYDILKEAWKTGILNRRLGRQVAGTNPENTGSINNVC